MAIIIMMIAIAAISCSFMTNIIKAEGQAESANSIEINKKDTISIQVQTNKNNK